MHSFLLNVCLIYIIQGHVTCITLYASPNYIYANTSISLTCNVNEFHEYGSNVKFFRNSDLLVSSECSQWHRYRRCNSILQICCDTYINKTTYIYRPDTTPTTDETFSCEINGINVQERNCTTVRAAALQSVTLSPLTTELNVTQGKTPRSITCSAVCWPICTFRWIGPNHFNRNGPELTLKVIPKSGSGTYWCQAKNVIGTKNSTNITITVQYGPDTIVVFPSELNGRYIRTEGDSIRNITCWADCHPVCNYTWTYPDKTTNVTSYFYEYALEKIHDGEYTCRAFNEIGSKEKTIRVVVNYAPENIQLSPNSTICIVQENNHVSITCSANCRPQCVYKWTGQIPWPLWNKQLFIRNVKRSNSGNYRCEVRNDVGRTYSSYVRLTVHTKPTKVKNITVKSTGSTTASIAWIPDMTVVPAQTFILHYKTRNDMDFTSVLFKEPENQQNIFLLHVKSLIPSTEYVFKISSENYLGQTESIEFRSVTRAGQISPIRPDFIGGIALILIALLVIIITMVLVHRFRLLTQRLDTTMGCSCCIKDSSSKTARPKERLYENTSLQLQNLGSSSEASGGIEEITQERGGATGGNVLSRPAGEPLIEEQYEIIQIPTTASLGVAKITKKSSETLRDNKLSRLSGRPLIGKQYENLTLTSTASLSVEKITKKSSETLRDNKLSRPSGRPLIRKQYENLQLTPTDRKQNNVSVHNAKTNTKTNQRKDHVEKKVLKPLVKSKPHMKT